MLKRLLLGRARSGWRSRRGESGAGPDGALDRARGRFAAGDAEAALRIVTEALADFPDSHALWNGAGIYRLACGEAGAAQACFEQALELVPTSAEARANLGIALAQQGDRKRAAQYLQRAIELAPELKAARESLAALRSLELDHDAALQAWEGVLTLDAEHAAAHAAKAFHLMREGRLTEARQSLARARLCGATPADVDLNEAGILTLEGETAAARALLEGLRGKVDDADIDWHIALSYLTEGDFGRGWQYYEARLRRTLESPRRGYPFPEWSGEPLADGALLIAAEQGLGDEIMFASCYGEAFRRARCVVECDPRLASLFTRSFPEARIVPQAREGANPALLADRGIVRQIHAGSLPKFFRTGKDAFPSRYAYLVPDPARVRAWRTELRRGGAHRVIGIAWSGGLRHTRRAVRSVPPTQFAALLRTPDTVFVSLQHDDDGSGARQLLRESGKPVLTFQQALANLDETASLMAAVDAVVTVCGTAAHLAGALGRPTLILAPHAAEWRYLHEGAAMPWYPTARILRQAESGEWGDVVQHARAAIAG